MRQRERERTRERVAFTEIFTLLTVILVEFILCSCCNIVITHAHLSNGELQLAGSPLTKCFVAEFLSFTFTASSVTPEREGASLPFLLTL